MKKIRVFLVKFELFIFSKFVFCDILLYTKRYFSTYNTHKKSVSMCIICRKILYFTERWL